MNCRFEVQGSCRGKRASHAQNPTRLEDEGGAAPGAGEGVVEVEQVRRRSLQSQHRAVQGTSRTQTQLSQLPPSALTNRIHTAIGATSEH